MEFFVRAVTATDWHDVDTVAAAASGERPRSWPDAQAALGNVEGANLTNFFNTRGLFTARSDWSTDALQVGGTHTHFSLFQFIVAMIVLIEDSETLAS